MPCFLASALGLANALAKKQGIYVGSYDEASTDAGIVAGRSLLDVNDITLARLLQDLATRLQELS